MARTTKNHGVRAANAKRAAAKRGSGTAKGRAAGASAGGGAAATRRPRSDRRDTAERYSKKMTLKFTEKGRQELTKQAAAANFKGDDSAYLRHLAEQHRKALGMGEFRFNTVPLSPPAAR